MALYVSLCMLACICLHFFMSTCALLSLYCFLSNYLCHSLARCVSLPLPPSLWPHLLVRLYLLPPASLSLNTLF